MATCPESLDPFISCSSSLHQPFIKLYTRVKKKGTFCWLWWWFIIAAFCSSNAKVVCGGRYCEGSVKKSRKVFNWRGRCGGTARNATRCSILDENVDVHLIRKFFSYDGWLAVTIVFEQKQRNATYVCRVCLHDLEEQPSVVCDHCLSWSHIKCVGLRQQPKSKYWYCRSCHESPFDSL